MAALAVEVAITAKPVLTAAPEPYNTAVAASSNILTDRIHRAIRVHFVSPTRPTEPPAQLKRLKLEREGRGVHQHGREQELALCRIDIRKAQKRRLFSALLFRKAAYVVTSRVALLRI